MTKEKKNSFSTASHIEEKIKLSTRTHAKVALDGFGWLFLL